MGFIGDIFSGDKGAGFQAQPATIESGVDPAQVFRSYGQTQNGLAQQQDFVNALNAQNGIGNQSSVFNQQQGLANQLQQQANGQGPNPAQNMLNQATGQNVANQQALMASQRGASANPALIARQAAQQGAGIQQNAAGQAATLGAQQQIAAQQGLQRQQAMMSGLASQQVGQQQGALNSFNQSAQHLYGLDQSSLAQKNQANVAMQSNMNNANAGIAGINAGTQGSIFGGAAGGLGTALMALNRGGMVPHYDEGGVVDESGPMSYVGQYLQGYGEVQPPQSNNAASQGTNQLFQGLGMAAKKLTSGSSSPITDAGFKSPQFGSQFAGKGASLGAGMGGAGGAEGGASLGMAAMKLDRGGRVPGHAQIAGDSIQNDKVPAMLSPGEIVIPNSVMNSKDPAKMAAKFVAAILAKKGRMS